MAGVLFQDQGRDQPIFIGTIGRKTTSYEANYHSSKGDLELRSAEISASFITGRVSRRDGLKLDFDEGPWTIPRWMCVVGDTLSKSPVTFAFFKCVVTCSHQQMNQDEY